MTTCQRLENAVHVSCGCVKVFSFPVNQPSASVLLNRLTNPHTIVSYIPSLAWLLAGKNGLLCLSG